MIVLNFMKLFKYFNLKNPDFNYECIILRIILNFSFNLKIFEHFI